MSLTDTQAGILEAAAVIGTVGLLHVPLGDYIFRHLGRTPAKPHWRVERWIYRGIGADPEVQSRRRSCSARPPTTP